MGIAQLGDAVVPSHALARVFRERERIAVESTEPEQLEAVPGVDIPAELAVEVANLGVEARDSSDKRRCNPLECLVFERQGRDTCRCHERYPVVEVRLAAGADEEVVYGAAHPVAPVGPAGVDAEVRRCEVVVRCVEASLGQRGVLDYGSRYHRRQAEQVGVAVYGHPVEREQVVSHVAAPDIECRRSVGTRRDAGHGLRPAYGIPLAERRHHCPYDFDVGAELADAALLEHRTVGDHGGVKGVYLRQILRSREAACRRKQDRGGQLSYRSHKSIRLVKRFFQVFPFGTVISVEPSKICGRVGTEYSESAVYIGKDVLPIVNGGEVG